MTSDYQVDALGITVFVFVFFKYDVACLVWYLLFIDACYDLCLGVAPLSRSG